MLTTGSPVLGLVVLVGVVTVIADPERCGGAGEHPQALQPVSEFRLDLDLHLETVITFVLLFGLVLDFCSVILLQLWGATVGCLCGVAWDTGGPTGECRCLGSYAFFLPLTSIVF